MLQRPNRRGFSLIEMVIVVMILGILATIALPKVLGTSKTATDNGVRQSLSVIRTAIDSYSAENDGKLPVPTVTNRPSRTRWPCTYAARNSRCARSVPPKITAFVWWAATERSPTASAALATHSWVYKYETGDFHVNSVDKSADGTTYDLF